MIISGKVFMIAICEGELRGTRYGEINEILTHKNEFLTTPKTNKRNSHSLYSSGFTAGKMWRYFVPTALLLLNSVVDKIFQYC